ncbi:MAG: DoxX family protein [Rhizobiaceae bacterium]|nr:DoxX family protein [Rhizobiaceae bacterium]
MSGTWTTKPSGDRLAICGWIVSGLVTAFLLIDATMKLLALPIVLEMNGQIGFPGAAMARELGIILLVCTVLYIVPRTTALGAILLTGYLGGAIATHLRVGSPLVTHTLFGVFLGLFIWGGLYLRDARIRELIPFRSGV